MHLPASPVDPVPDIACEDCFNLQRRALFDDHEHQRMPDDVLVACVAQLIESGPAPVVEFADTAWATTG